MDRKIIVDVEIRNIEEFAVHAKRAKDMGATHVMVSQLPRSRWMWEADLSDPYPNWCMRHAQLFKLVCPPQLENYLPIGFIAECFALVKARCDILKSLNMKGALFSNEPFWLPEAVYRDHPAWRGTRCDHPRRAKHTYYSPCVDNTEVLELYRYAVRELVSKTGIDFILFKSNDAGGGLCWSNGTYSGPNGPETCKRRSMADRINGFLDALNAGAADAGLDITLCFNANLGFKIEEQGAAEAWRGAKDNYIINGRNNKGEYPTAVLNMEPEWIRGIPNIFSFARDLGDAVSSGKPILAFQLNYTDFGEKWKYAKNSLVNTPVTWKACMDGIYETAKQIVPGREDLLTDAFYYISEGELHFSHDGLGLIMYGIVHQRWINRPFVLFPEELTEDERSYYRRFQFQALDEKHANDLLDMQNIECARGFSAAFLLSQTVRKASESFNKAIALLTELGKKEAKHKDKSDMLIRRLKIYNCLMKTCVNAALFQNLVDGIDYSAEPPLDSKWPTRNDLRIEQYQNITRSEIDNAYELADLLEGYEEQIFHIADEENEDIFVFGPHLVSQIRKKAAIMLNHELDGNRVFERHNI
ncbi:MAG: hypothetical protein LBP76_14185 [Treponema sp.]|jgi:hypothetical protein|nr:hypothetical protein [Treponema sp.]